MTASTGKSATLTTPDGKTAELPVLSGVLGPNVIDIRKLYAATGMFTYDPGYTSTASTTSKITYIDGDEGVLLHRGYSIEELATKSGLSGSLPPAADRRTADCRGEGEVRPRHHLPHDAARADPLPVPRVSAGQSSHGGDDWRGRRVVGFYYEDLHVDDPHHRKIATHRLIAKLPTIAAMAYKYTVGQPFVYPRNDLSYSENFLHMMFAVPCERYEVDPVHAKALDRIFILHADHEQNASTSTVRLVGSTGASPYAAIAAGIAALWGPAHGGANEAVLTMLREIGDPSRIPEFIEKAKDKDSGARLMGFGHRVYKNYDPRAQVLKESADQVLAQLGKGNNPLLAIARELEKIALSDDYFVKRKLFPNVDSTRASSWKRWGFRRRCSPRSSRWPARSAGSHSGTR